MDRIKLILITKYLYRKESASVMRVLFFSYVPSIVCLIEENVMLFLQYLSKRSILLIVLAIISSHVNGEEGYLLKPGDQLEISVWNEEALQREVLVLPDGSVTFPLVGTIDVSGKTASALQTDIKNRLKDYVPEASVTVSVLQVTGNRIYVIGKVTNPGTYELSAPTDILQALSLAGGFVRFADTDNIVLLRRENGVQKTIPFNYSDILKGKNVKSNAMLQSGDQIIVP